MTQLIQSLVGTTLRVQIPHLVCQVHGALMEKMVQLLTGMLPHTCGSLDFAQAATRAFTCRELGLLSWLPVLIPVFNANRGRMLQQRGQVLVLTVQLANIQIMVQETVCHQGGSVTSRLLT